MPARPGDSTATRTNLAGPCVPDAIHVDLIERDTVADAASNQTLMETWARDRGCVPALKNRYLKGSSCRNPQCISSILTPSSVSSTIPSNLPTMADITAAPKPTEVFDPNIAEANALESLGYQQELKRDFSLLGMLAFSFSIVTCWSALAGVLIIGAESGGPPVMVWSWLGICAFSLTIAYSMAEMCSA